MPGLNDAFWNPAPQIVDTDDYKKLFLEESHSIHEKTRKQSQLPLMLDFQCGVKY
jgi:hypothetical protein